MELARPGTDQTPICLTGSALGDLSAEACAPDNTRQELVVQAETAGSHFGITSTTGAGALVDAHGRVTLVPDAGTAFLLIVAGANPEPVD